MRRMIASLVLAGLMGGSGAASAAPIQGSPVDQPATAPGVIYVAGGCGIGFHRGPYGGCRRNAGVRIGPVVIGRPGPYRRPCRIVVGPYGGRRRVCY